MAGNIQIGNVGGITKIFSVTPTVTAANAYGTNYVVGGLLTFNNALNGFSGSGILQAVTVTIKDVETSGFTFFPFVTNPSATTWTDAAVAALDPTDVSKVLAPVPLSANSQLKATVFTVYYAYGLGLPLSATITNPTPAVPGTETIPSYANLPLYGVLLANAALTNNFAGASDVTVSVTILQDA